MSDELKDPAGSENLVRDGLSGVAHPVPRDGGAGAVESGGGTVGSGLDAGGSGSGAAEAEAKGLNAAAGPAADQEAGTPDNRGLATDTSSSG